MNSFECYEKQYPILDRALMTICLVALVFIVTMFVLYSLWDRVHISYGWIVLMGALFVIVVSDSHDLEHYLHQVQWSTLLFFTCLFVIMGCMKELGLVQSIGHLVRSVVEATSPRYQTPVTIVLFIWLFGILSGVLDNVPMVTLMLGILPQLHASPAIKVSLVPMVLAMTFACGFGGNGSLIGSSANVVCVDVAAAHGHNITFKNFFV